MKFNTPLRYPGGKDHLGEFIQMVIDKNSLLGGHYVESYAGGAGIALNLLTHGYVSYIHLNDANPAIYAFWHSVINQPEALCKLIQDVEITMEEWQRQKTILASSESYSLLEVGFSVFFLYRTNRLGILWGGATSGKNQFGHWKFDARFNKVDLISRIKWLALYRSRIQLYNLNITDLIKTVLPYLPEKTITYFDSSYPIKERRLGEDHYSYDTHVSLANLINKHMTHEWIVTCDDNPEIIKTYKDYSNIIYNINYSSEEFYKRDEVILFSKGLIIPNFKNPSNLKTI